MCLSTVKVLQKKTSVSLDLLAFCDFVSRTLAVEGGDLLLSQRK